MKSIKSILAISIIVTFAIPSIHACGGGIYPLNIYFMYRINDRDAYDLVETLNDSSNSATQNCELWQQLTSTQIPIDDIRDLVYDMSLSEFEKLYSESGYSGQNRFAIWLKEHNDTEILDFLLLAKSCENIRLQENSRWYYPSKKQKGGSFLDEIVEKALDNKSPRLRDRYLLQAIRALFSLERYDECISLWKNEISKFPTDNLMRNMAYEYVIGADIHTISSKEAFEYCLKTGHIEYLTFSKKYSIKYSSYLDIFELVYQYSLNSKYIENYLYSFVRDAESNRLTDDHRRLKDLALRIGADPKIKNQALWYYTAAFIANLEGNCSEATHILTLAEKAPGTPSIKDSIKILRMHVDAQTLPYDNAYERKLFEQLSWLDKKIRFGYNCDTFSIADRLKNTSAFYWNDMLRRIVLDDICPRMVASGHHTRALQLANMAENRLIHLCKNIEYYDSLSIEEYRRSKEFNNLDYFNYFIAMADTIGTDNFIEYHNRVKRPQSDFDRFLNARGYTDSDYLNDIAGTLCLRSMRYEDAEQYLRNIKPSFAYHLNTKLKYDPFKIQFPKRSQGIFKYQFAKEMVHLQHTFSTSSDPDIKANAMYRFAVGLHNSFSNCWQLTQYWHGSYSYNSDIMPRN